MTVDEQREHLVHFDAELVDGQARGALRPDGFESREVIGIAGLEISGALLEFALKLIDVFPHLLRREEP